jgi:hypothetical protein
VKSLVPILITALAAPLLSLSAAPASAAERFPLPGGVLLFPAGVGCAFDVESVFTSKEYLAFRPDGSISITGRFTASLTNVATGTSITVNASGPGTISADGLMSSGRGGQLFVVVAGEFGGPGIFLRHGRVVYTRTPEGLIDPLVVTGNSRNLCDDLV